MVQFRNWLETSIHSIMSTSNRGCVYKKIYGTINYEYVFSGNNTCILDVCKSIEMYSRYFHQPRALPYMYLIVNFIWLVKVFPDSVSCSCKKHPPECTQHGLKAFEPRETRNLSHPFILLVNKDSHNSPIIPIKKG